MLVTGATPPHQPRDLPFSPLGASSALVQARCTSPPDDSPVTPGAVTVDESRHSRHFPANSRPFTATVSQSTGGRWVKKAGKSGENETSTRLSHGEQRAGVDAVGLPGSPPHRSLPLGNPTGRRILSRHVSRHANRLPLVAPLAPCPHPGRARRAGWPRPAAAPHWCACSGSSYRGSYVPKGRGSPSAARPARP